MYNALVATHLGTVLLAFPIGGWLLLSKKGTRVHKLLGKPYMVLMFITAIASLAMPANVGPTLFGHLGFIHFFSFLVLYSVPAAYISIRKGDVKAHRSAMMGVYIGGILVAGTFAFMPGRMMHQFLFG